MKHLLIALSLLMITISNTMSSCNECQNHYFYIKAESGISASKCANITAPCPPWNQANQGYNSELGNCPILGLSVGCEILNIIDLEANISNRSIFKYRKYQTSSDNSSYTREFDLNITSFLFYTYLIGKSVHCLNWSFCCGKIYPLIGLGLGASNLLITNFRTTGLPSTGGSYPYDSFTSENQYTLRRNFTYTLSAGLEYNRNDWAISTGYRWFNAGCFKGPQYLRASNGSAVDIGCNTWNMQFKSNEWFIQLKIFI